MATLSAMAVATSDLVATYEFEAPPLAAAQRHLNRTLRFLRFTTGASIHATEVRMTPRTPLPWQGGFGSLRGPARPTHLRRHLGPWDRERAFDLWGMLGPKVPVLEGSPTTPLHVALDRYEKALLEPGPVEQRLLYAVMGLEALLLTGADRQGQSRALAQRGAFAHDAWGGDGRRMYQVLRRAYNTRSRYVHGVAAFWIPTR